MGPTDKIAGDTDTIDPTKFPNFDRESPAVEQGRMPWPHPAAVIRTDMRRPTAAGHEANLINRAPEVYNMNDLLPTSDADIYVKVVPLLVDGAPHVHAIIFRRIGERDEYLHDGLEGIRTPVGSAAGPIVLEAIRRSLLERYGINTPSLAIANPLPAVAS